MRGRGADGSGEKDPDDVLVRRRRAGAYVPSDMFQAILRGERRGSLARMLGITTGPRL